MPNLDSCDLRIVEGGTESLTRHGMQGFVVGCYQDDLNKTPRAAHWHYNLEILRVVKGSAEITLGAERRVLRRGDGAFVSSGALHSMTPPSMGGESIVEVVIFSPVFIAGETRGPIWERYVAPLVQDASSSGYWLDPEVSWQNECLKLEAKAVEIYRGEAAGYEFEMREALTRAVFLVSSNKAEAVTVSRHDDLVERRTKQMIAYVDAHIGDQITLADLAAASSVSQSECLRCFKAVVGEPPMRYIRKRRVRTAAIMLEQTDDSAAMIASACGFCDASHLTRAFREVMGTTPNEYRKTSAVRG